MTHTVNYNNTKLAQSYKKWLNLAYVRFDWKLQVVNSPHQNRSTAGLMKYLPGNEAFKFPFNQQPASYVVKVHATNVCAFHKMKDNFMLK